MEDFDYPEDAPGKIVYRQIWRVLRSTEVPEDFFCEFFENLSLWEESEDVPSSDAEEVSLDSNILENAPSCSKTDFGDTSSQSKAVVEKRSDKEKQHPKEQNIKQKPCAKALAEILMYISATLEVYKREGMTQKLTRECEHIKKNMKFGEEKKRKIEAEMRSVLNFFNLHKDRKCLYFIMMDIGARKVGSYFNEYLQLPTASCTDEGDTEEEILDVKCKMCLFHVTEIVAYCYTMSMQLKHSCVYLTRLNKNYEEAIKDITSRKGISILFSVSSTTQPLSMMAVTTSKTTYIIDFLAGRIKYLPAEIGKMLEQKTIDKFVWSTVDFFKYIYLRHNVRISNLYDVQAQDLEVRRQLDPTCRELSLSELLEKGAERLDNVKFKMEPDLLQKWHSRPVSKEVINTTATACMYMYKISCCLQLTEMFLSHELKQHFAKAMDIVTNKP